MLKSSDKSFSVVSRLLCGSAIAAISASAAYAQPAPAPSAETVTVTGTILRNAGPTGSNLITVDRAAIQATGATTIQNILSTVPGLNNFNGAGQGAVNSSDPAGAQSPTIHSLGSSASNGTLILVDNHRLPYTGNGHSTIDPSSIPTIALQQVQVLADGASSTYGSDAVAGVLNFITRKNFTGMEFTAQYAFANSSYSTFNGGALFGHAWDGGSAMIALAYTSKSELQSGVRNYENPRQDLRLGATSGLPTLPQSTACPVGGFATIAGTCIIATTPDATHGTNGAPFSATVPSGSLGANFDNFNCPIATIKQSSAGTTSYLYPYTPATGLINNITSFNGVCSEANTGTDLPSETRNTIFTSIKQNLSDNLSMNIDFDYSFREDASRSNYGTLSSIAFGPTSGRGAPATGTAFSATTGLPVTTTTTTTTPSCATLAIGCGQINPFYTSGTTGLGTSSEFVQYDFEQLMAANGVGRPLSKTFDETAYIVLGFVYDLGSSWEATLGGTAGTDYSGQRQSNTLCSACANLALNGTTNVTGAPNTSVATTAIVDPNGLGTVSAQSRSLTNLNALDVWDPVSSNKTSAAVLKQIQSGYSLATGEQSIQDVSFKVDGNAFDLPAGPIKLAVGFEFTHNTMVAEFANQSSTLAAAPLAATFNAVFGRTVYAAFTEALIPLVSPDMNVPLMQHLNIDISGRWDQYSFYGDTENPKIGFSWGVIDGLAARGSYSTSFTVPAFNSGGINGTGITSQSNASSTNTVPVASGTISNTVLFNDPRYNSGHGVAGTWIATAAGCVAAGSLAVNSAGATVAATDPTAVACKVNNSGATPGLSIGGGGGDPGGGIHPETGRSYSFGIDFDAGKWFDALDGLSGEVTFYQATYRGLITNINITTSNLGLTTFAPPGGWASTDPVVIKALGNEPLTSTLQQTLWFYTLGGQNNAYNLWSNGLDYGVNYRFMNDWGDFRAGVNGNEILRFTQQNIGSTALFTDLNGDAGSQGRFTAQQMTLRANLDWSMDALHAGISFNYQSAFKASNSSYPYTTSPANTIFGGFQHIGPLETFDLNGGYTIPEGWMAGVGGTQVNLTVTNLFDQSPPFANSATGFSTGSQIGRLVAVSLRRSL